MRKMCQCCGAEMTGSKCPYCGFVEIIDMDDSGTTLVQSMAANHKKALAAALTDISVVSHSYRWNGERSRLEPVETQTLKLADGGECYPEVKWTGQTFGQLPAGEDITLELAYKFRGEEKRLSCKVPTLRCDDFWRIGLVVDQSLKLKVLLGTETTHTESAAFALDLS